MVTSASELLILGEKKLAGCILLLLLELFIEGAKCVTRVDIENHLELGREYLARGQLSDALSHYHAAVEGDPANYLTFFKRGTVYLALGKTKFALTDFSKVLELKPDFTAARIQRAHVYMKTGDYTNAEKDYWQVLQDDPNNEEVRSNYNRIDPIRNQWEQVQDTISKRNYKTAIVLLTQLLEISPFSSLFRKTRADCYIKDNDILSAVSDLRSVNKLSQGSTEGYYELSVLLYKIGQATNALKEIRECLRLDPEHKDCFPLYKKIKKIEKYLTDAESAQDEKRYNDCIEAATNTLKHEKDIQMIIFNAKQLLCSCYTKDEQYTEAINKCSEALDIKQEPDILCNRAEAYIGTEMYDDAIHDYQDALKLDEHLQKAKEGVERAKKLQKQSERRDYYKILDVKRTATKQEIIKAYRKAAQKWHPDNYQGEQKKVAEKKFIDIAAAKEVLTDPEKRQQFDNGHDPLDPESDQNGFHRSTFHHFHHGSPFQFKFHFN